VVAVALPVEAGTEPAAGALAFFAEQALERSDRFQVVRIADALDPAGAEARARKEAEAEAAMADGQKAYDELDTVAALAQFEKAANLFAQTDLSRGFRRWVEAQLLRASCLVANGELKVAEVELDRVLALEPRVQLSPNLFPPETLAYAEKVKRSLGQGAARLKVSSSPSGARVFVDGRYQGVAPVELEGLTAADHYVTAVLPGRGLMQRRARGGNVEFELVASERAGLLAAALAGVRADPEGPGRDRALKTLGTALGVDQVLAVLVRRGATGETLSLTGLRLVVSDGHNAGWEVRQVAAGEGLPVDAEAFYAGMISEDAPRRGGPVTHFPAGAGPDGRTLAGWGLLAGGAALVLGGATFGVLALQKSSEFKGSVQTSPEAAAARSTGQTFAVLADVGVVAGLAAAGAGAWLTFFSGGPKGPQKPKPQTSPAVPEPVPPTPTEASEGSRRKGTEDDRGKTKLEKKRAAEEAAAASKREREEKRRAAEETAAAAKREKEERRRAAEEARRPKEKLQPASVVEPEPAAPPPEQPAPDEPAPPPAPDPGSKRARDEEKRKREDEERRKREDEEKRAREDEEKRKREDEERRKREDEERRKRDAEEKRKREDDEKRKREDDEKRKREDEEKRKREDEERRKREDEKKRKRTDDDDDLRNY
jgi:hypothetical protein